jgi:hypothetical protein
MSLTPTQAIVTTIVKGNDLTKAAESLRQALLPYPDARIVALTQKTDWMTSWSGTTALLTVIDFTPGPAKV